ncbi:MAG: hypothetical protein JW881_13935 [Spirochaetales bacterium]|nr:hypothetical protein [Spirochaetales bacterium]
MRSRIKAAYIMGKRELFEVCITPGVYIALTLGLVTGFLLVAGFIHSIGSSGLDYNNLNPAYDMIFKSLSGAFGGTFVDKLFSEGPFFFALVLSFLPVLVYLSVSSVFKFGFEKNTGVIELISYGPADGTSYFLASFAKNCIVTGLSLAALFLFYSLASLIGNLVLGPTFVFALFLLFFFSCACYGYVVFVSVVAHNAASAVAAFIAIFTAFVLLHLMSLAMVAGYVKSFSGIIAWALRWFSPVFYWSFGLDSVDYGNIGGFFLSVLLLLVLSGALLGASHTVLGKKGVRG